MSEDFINGDIVKQKSDVLERYGKVVEPQSVLEITCLLISVRVM